MIRYALPLLFLAAPALAQSVGDCGHLAAAAYIAEPWGQNTATFANGDVRVALIDTMEPAAAAVHLLVLSPPRDEIGERQCRFVSLSRSEGGGPIGFFDIDFAAHEAAYDPAQGLVLTMPMAVYVPETGGGEPAELTVTINQSTGEIRAEVAGS
ncbi:hypothetical protein [Paracoccus xiamenensis]|uniref:hypothetical protein n=1 Tax=Paracoccus xiamenensis TaxID=2714901 RepID=UPI001407CAAF|nr:hypothetical protein [Paracoccus xiamenensis]NHF73629.1 hypothetical protein [Paracoccus xiamenensis]